MKDVNIYIYIYIYIYISKSVIVHRWAKTPQKYIFGIHHGAYSLKNIQKSALGT
jgi:hypothetical protein